MRMDEVKGGVKVFSAGGDDADEEGLRVYHRLRRNQSEGGGGAGTAAAAAKKRRNWKASEPVTAIGELRKSRSDVAASAVVAKRVVARVSTPEKKVAAAGGEVKEVVEVEKAPLEESNNFEEETEEEDEEELEEELEPEEEEKEVLDQDHMAVDDEETVKSTAMHQGVDQDLEPPTKRGSKPVTEPVEDERAANPEPVKLPPEKKLAAAIDLQAMNPEPMTPPPAVEKKTTPVVIHRMTNAKPARPSPEKKASPVIGRRIPKQEPVNTPPVEDYEEVQGRPPAPSRSNGRMQNIVDLVMWRDVSKSALVFGLGTFLLISSSYAKGLSFNTITSASYLGLVYLGLRFLCKSILNRWKMHSQDGSSLCMGCELCWAARIPLPSRLAPRAETTLKDLGTTGVLRMVEAIIAVEKHVLESGSIDTVGTVGILQLHPGAINSIPSKSHLEIDVRDIHEKRRNNVIAKVHQSAIEIAKIRGVVLSEFKIINQDPPALSDKSVINAMKFAAKQLSLEYKLMISRAYHNSGPVWYGSSSTRSMDLVELGFPSSTDP